MIWYFSPFSLEKRLFQAYDQYAELVKNENDWICFLDGDVLFLIPEWGKLLQQYVDKYPEFGLLTSYASRAGYPSAMPKIGDPGNGDILFHKEIADKLYNKHKIDLAIKPYNRNVSGHLMLIKKSTWSSIREVVKRKVSERSKKILGVDTMISQAILETGLNIGLMRGVYVLHYFRLKEKGNKHHLI